ncbi:MAG: acyltransferase [Sporocytophaga sp.]|uniref:acyltransferase n=1 Tax=Sporocytophaga sp. TaxID=2231183 RepID=UPI001B1528A3|nr:acyltransferase [Sporocytophaga sp.]MBO9701640.1 acyltransferase [Sporocytophaga sp.]
MKNYFLNGNINVEDGANVNFMDIMIYDARKRNLNVQIGKDSIIHCDIVLYKHDSKVTIGDRVFIGEGTKIYCYDSVEIKDDVMISWGCTIIDTNAHSISFEERKNDVVAWKKGYQFKDWSNVKFGKIVIERNCWIGFNSIVMKGVHLDENVIVGAGSVVTKSFSKNLIVGGNPAQVVKQVE